jgi:hypothetical protein
MKHPVVVFSYPTGWKVCIDKVTKYPFLRCFIYSVQMLSPYINLKQDLPLHKRQGTNGHYSIIVTQEMETK